MSTEPSGGRTAEDVPLPGGDFSLFIARLNIHGLKSLGVLENPVTGKSHMNLEQAKMLVLDLEMLVEKTSGNLSQFEQNQLTKVTSDLRHLYESKAER
jgi:hypothetical protein